jgi:hypothetical protein
MIKRIDVTVSAAVLILRPVQPRVKGFCCNRMYELGDIESSKLIKERIGMNKIGSNLIGQNNCE